MYEYMQHFRGGFPCTGEVIKLVLPGKNDYVHLREYGDDLTPDVRSLIDFACIM